MRCVDLFCGAGGFSLGFLSQGFEIIAALDRSDDAISTYRHNFPEVGDSAIRSDIRKISAADFCEAAGITPEAVDVVIGGPPCKGFSHAGKMEVDDPRNNLLSNYISMVEGLDPKAIILENVLGMLQMQDGQYKDRVIGGLRDAGYEIDEPHILNAADYGVPQLRERAIFLGSKSGPIQPPTPTYQSPSAGNDSRKNHYISVKEAISDLAFIGIGMEATEYQIVPQSPYQEEMRQDNNVLHNHKSTNHSDKVARRFKMLDWGEGMGDLPEEHQTSKHSMRRWHPDKPAFTVTSLPDDFVHYLWDRIPTVRENARLQSFPDDFEFKGNRTTGGKKRRRSVPQYTQVGNAVPPKLAQAIARAVAKYFNKKPAIHPEI